MSTKLHTPNERGGTDFLIVRDGVAGNYDVIYEMIRVIRRAVENDKGLEVYAKDILISRQLDSYSEPITICNAVMEQLKPEYDGQGFLSSGVAYISDKGGRIEDIKSPRQTLSDGFGDCDDQTILVAALLGCVGFEDVRIAMTRYAPDDPSFTHVYAVAYKDGKRFAMDTTIPDPRVNREVKPYEIKEIGVFDEVDGLDGVSGFYNNTRYHSRKFAKAALEALPNVAEVVPLGFVIGNALATGGDLLNRSQGADQLSYVAAVSKINRELDGIIRRLMQSQIALDTAKSRAANLAVQLTMIPNAPADRRAKNVVHESVRTKFDFINNFQAYADANGIAVVNLDSRAMMIAGIAFVAGAGYLAYNRFFRGVNNNE